MSRSNFSAAPVVSLIMCTANTERRVAEVSRLLESLSNQSFVDFEVIVVDQNIDFDISPLLENYKDRFFIRHVTHAIGLSRSRNFGLRFARGQICAFPDDDCWYAPDLLDRVVAFFDENADYSGLHGKGWDPNSGYDMARFDSSFGDVVRSNVFERSVSCALFYRARILEKVGGFDENLGLGSGTRWVGCEDYDIPIRLLAEGERIFYDPDLAVYHPCPSSQHDAQSVKRARAQSPSFGYLLSKHSFPLAFVFFRTLRPLGGCVLGIVRLDLWKVRYHWAAFEGRLRGVFSGFGAR